jgi:Bacteriocin-protection, YdeI or OmpD-Associated/Domain of unknown function (DUF1905)
MPSPASPPVQTFSATVVRDGPSCYVLLPFDPKAVFGTVRAPVVVTIAGYTFRSRIVAMGGPICVGLRESHRRAAGLEGGETVKVQVGLDTAARTVTAPADLLRALKAVPGALDAWKASSYTHQREHVEAIEGAKKPETRERRVAAAVAMVTARVKAASRGIAKKRTARR